MTDTTPDFLRDQQHRQTSELTAAVRDLLRAHAETEAYPMLGAASAALAQNLGETIGQVEVGPMRTDFRIQVQSLMKVAEQTAPALGKIKTVKITAKH